MQAIQFGRFAPSPHVPEGSRLLVTGELTVTVSSRQSGKHMTVRMRCSRREPDSVTHWPTVPFDEATIVWIDSYDGQELGAYSPRHGVIIFNPMATAADQWTIQALLRYLAGAYPALLEQAELAAA